eukprot:jgi/Mesvir1/15716/Mv03296-RA.3
MTRIRNQTRGILGDDMGLGKTLQAIGLMAAILRKSGNEDVDAELSSFRREGNQPILVIVPPTLMDNWADQLSKWCRFQVGFFHGNSRESELDKVDRGGYEVVVAAYESMATSKRALETHWHCVFLDEAHKLKNHRSDLYRNLRTLRTRWRCGLTGTPIQNRFEELYWLLDFVAPGCAGEYGAFKNYYSIPIKKGRVKDASAQAVALGDARRRELQELVRRHMLRRTKEDQLPDLKGKDDNVVFCEMTDLQRRVYNRLLDTPEAQAIIDRDEPCSCGSGFKQQECHGRLVTEGQLWRLYHKNPEDGCSKCPICMGFVLTNALLKIANHLELLKADPSERDTDKAERIRALATVALGPDARALAGVTVDNRFLAKASTDHCGKLRAFDRLLERFFKDRAKVLVFSSGVRMLDILEAFVLRQHYNYSRLDGNTPVGERQRLVDEFNSSASKFVFLISTKAGGLGLNITSANRVIIFDPNWNPSHDLQAQDRAYRTGQMRHVEVYRLLSVGSIEELIYTRQIYKQQLQNTIYTDGEDRRFFHGVMDVKGKEGELFGYANLLTFLGRSFTSDIIKSATREINGMKIAEYDPGPDASRASRRDVVDLDVDVLADLHDEGISVYTHKNTDVQGHSAVEARLTQEAKRRVAEQERVREEREAAAAAAADTTANECQRGGGVDLTGTSPGLPARRRVSPLPLVTAARSDSGSNPRAIAPPSDHASAYPQRSCGGPSKQASVLVEVLENGKTGVADIIVGAETVTSSSGPRHAGRAPEDRQHGRSGAVGQADVAGSVAGASGPDIVTDASGQQTASPGSRASPELVVLAARAHDDATMMSSQPPAKRPRSLEQGTVSEEGGRGSKRAGVAQGGNPPSSGSAQGLEGGVVSAGPGAKVAGGGGGGGINETISISVAPGDVRASAAPDSVQVFAGPCATQRVGAMDATHVVAPKKDGRRSAASDAKLAPAGRQRIAAEFACMARHKGMDLAAFVEWYKCASCEARREIRAACNLSTGRAGS